MKKKQRKHLISKKASLFLLLAFTLTSCGKPKSTDVGTLIINENKSNNEDTTEKDKEFGIKERKKDTSDVKTEIKENATSVFKLSEHIEEIGETLKKLHHFTNNRMSIYENNMETLKSLNCSFDTELNTIVYQEKNSTVIASIVKDFKVTKIDDKTYNFDLVIATGESLTGGLNREQVGLNLIDYLKDDKYNKSIRYTLKINEDDTKGILNLNDLKWFEK